MNCGVGQPLLRSGCHYASGRNESAMLKMGDAIGMPGHGGGGGAQCRDAIACGQGAASAWGSAWAMSPGEWMAMVARVIWVSISAMEVAAPHFTTRNAMRIVTGRSGMDGQAEKGIQRPIRFLMMKSLTDLNAGLRALGRLSLSSSRPFTMAESFFMS